MESLSTDNKPAPVSVEEYLTGELRSQVRHEYIDGMVYAMGGASDRHALIVNALAFSLTPAARDRRCQLFTSDMKVRLEIDGKPIFYYPDLLLSCDPSDRATYYRVAPCLIIEVLSDGTERTDRREKLLAYQTVDSLQEYLLVSQDRPRLEIYRRTAAWQPEIISQGSFRIECLDLMLTLAEIYRDLED